MIQTRFNKKSKRTKTMQKKFSKSNLEKVMKTKRMILLPIFLKSILERILQKRKNKRNKKKTLV